MKKQLSLAAAAFLIAACGDTVENINQTGMDVVADAKDLPKCTADNEGDLAFVKKDNSTRVCVNGEWFVTTSEGSAAADFSCKTEELKDKSGLKIVCNGDSIGVVLNGSDGKDGKQGEAGKDGDAGTGCEITDRNDTAVVVKCGESTMTIDLNIGLPNDTAEADSERTPISLDSLVGFTQKGPFLKGSTVYLYELSDGRTLKQTNGNFTSNITQDNGRYKFLARDLVSQYAMVVVDGYYRNEVTGVSSNAPIRLKAITDMRKRNSVNVNILTHLEFERVYHLVTRGDKDGKKQTVKKAKQQAQKEIMDIFSIKLGDGTDAEDMDVFGSSDADAALLAISILLQGDRTESEMMALLSEISTDIAEDGLWNSARADTIKAQMADWAFGQELVKFRKNVNGWGLTAPGDSVGDFEKYIYNFIAETYDIDVCEAPSTDEQTIQNKLSAFSGRSFQCYLGSEEDSLENATWVDVRDSSYLNYDAQYAIYGHLIDWRDRRLYNTWKFYAVNQTTGPHYELHYNGRYIMAENLDFDYRIGNKSYGTYCYDDICNRKEPYGRLYTWASAMDSAGLYSSDGAGCGYNKSCSDLDLRRGVCPEGWHIMSVAEYEYLVYQTEYETIDTLASYYFKTQRGWDDYTVGDKSFDGNGVNEHGFSIYPAGGRLWDGDYVDAGRCAFFWLSSEKTSTMANIWWAHSDPSVGKLTISDKREAYSVRCVKND